MAVEAMIEKAAREHMMSLGGVCLKFTSPSTAGVPDRILSHPNCGVFFLEFKSPGKKLRPVQVQTCAALTKAGMRIYTDVDSIVKAKKIIDDEIAKRPGARHPYMDGIE